jgi:hypothetical protein
MRYTLTIQDSTPTPASSNFVMTYDVDIRKLIPTELRNSRFLVKSSFHTGTLGDYVHGNLGVSIGGLPSAYNKTIPEVAYTRLGIARPFLCSHEDASNGQFSYSFSENECLPIVIDYPEISRVVLAVASPGAEDIIEGCPFTLSLSFETL